MKQPAKIDVSVLILFFNRPDHLSQVFAEVRKARPARLFLYQDGPRGERDMAGIEACRKVVDADWDGEPMFFLDGAVITSAGNRIRCPDGFPTDLIIDADVLTGEMGILYTPSPEAESDSDLLYAVNYYRLDEGVWFVEWEKYENLDQRMNELYDYRKSFAGIEKAFSTQLVLISTASRETDEHPLFYKSDSLPEAVTAEELGITGEMLSKSFSTSDELTGEALGTAYQILVIGDQRYEVFFRDVDSSVIPDITAAYLTPFVDTQSEIVEQMGIILVLFAAIGIVFLVWLFSVLLLVACGDDDSDFATRPSEGSSSSGAPQFSQNLLVSDCFVLQ